MAKAKPPPTRGRDGLHTAAASLTVAQVLAWRMKRQLLHPVGCLGVVETIRATVGIQAQVPSSAELALALRRGEGRSGEAAEAIEKRNVMRTWAMRGTLHLLDPAAQAPALLALLRTSRTWERPAWRRTFGFGTEDLETLIETVLASLDGRVLEREALIEEIAQRTGSRDLEEQLRSGWGAVLKPLAWMGYLCNGPSRSGRVTFTRPDTWFADWKGLPAIEPAARIAIPAYLRSYGPATIKSFHAWLAREACPPRDVRRWFESVTDLLVTVEVDGEPRLALADDLDELRSSPPARGVRLLAGFDQYVLGPGTGDTQIVAAHRRSEVSRAAGWISPVVLDAGRVAGVWKLDDDLLSVTLFAESRKLGMKALQAEARRVSAAVGRDLRLAVANG